MICGFLQISEISESHRIATFVNGDKAPFTLWDQIMIYIVLPNLTYVVQSIVLPQKIVKFAGRWTTDTTG